ncbi:MAG: type IV pilin protein [Porticoccaceae bacterium]
MNKITWRRPGRSSAGFTLIEMMITVVVVAILAAIALPSYTSYIKRSNARAAGADLMALSTALENVFQRTLNYPDAETDTTDETQDKVTGWSPAQGANFDFTMDSDSASSKYTLTAAGKGTMEGCDLTLNEKGERNDPDSDACGGLVKW